MKLDARRSALPLGLLAAGLAFAGAARANAADGQQSPPASSLPCFFQATPGDTPQVFAPGVISTDAHEFGCSFAPDGKEIYFSRRVGTPENPTRIMVSRCVDGTWTEPEAAPFNDPAARMSFEPMVTPDGRRLYFSSDRPLPSQPAAGGRPSLNIWYVDREGDHWSAPKDPGAPFNPMKAMYVSATNSGTLYAMDISGGFGKERIALSRFVEGVYGAFETVAGPINGGTRVMYPWVAPDESYLVVSSPSDPERSHSTLLVSHRKTDGTWNELRPVDLGIAAGTPLVSPDGLFLFFTGGERGKGDIYWVSKGVLNR